MSPTQYMSSHRHHIAGFRRPLSFDRRTSLHCVLEDNDVDLLQEFLDAGANPDMQDNDGNYPPHSPLHWAAMYGHRKCVRALLAANANPNLESIDGDTPLNGIGINPCPEIVMDLLSYGANVMHRNKAGRTALQELGLCACALPWDRASLAAGVEGGTRGAARGGKSTGRRR